MSDRNCTIARATASAPRRVGITGAGGTLGQALSRDLGERFELARMSRSLDGTDLLDLEGLIDRFHRLDAVVHLAWQYADSDSPESIGYYDNLTMNRNVLLAATHADVSTVLLASSVHADYFYNWEGPELKHVGSEPRGTGPYGAAKVLVEELGREYAGEAMRVACIRYGAVTDDDAPHPWDAWERRVWLSQRDLCRLIAKALESDWPEAYVLCYAVSRNAGRVHHLANPFGWKPIDCASPLAGDN